MTADRAIFERLIRRLIMMGDDGAIFGRVGARMTTPVIEEVATSTEELSATTLEAVVATGDCATNT